MKESENMNFCIIVNSVFVDYFIIDIIMPGKFCCVNHVCRKWIMENKLKYLSGGHQSPI